MVSEGGESYKQETEIKLLQWLGKSEHRSTLLLLEFYLSVCGLPLNNKKREVLTVS